LRHLNQSVGVIHAFVHGRSVPSITRSRWAKGWITPTPYFSTRSRLAQYAASGADLGGHLPCLDHLLSVPAHGRSPHLACAPLAPATPAMNAPPLRNRSGYRPGRATGALDRWRLHKLPATLSPLLAAQATFTRVPSGTTPDSRNRHRSITRRRAKATIPMRRWRLLPPPKRSWNQRLCLFCGW